MTMLRVRLLLALLGLLSGCGIFSPAGEDLQDEPGMVTLFAPVGSVFVIKPDSEPAVTYLPHSLPAAFRQDSLRVIFSGNIRPIPPDPPWPSESLLPLEVTTIRIAE